MIPKNIFVIQIKVVIADFRTGHAAFSKTVVKGGIQMIKLAVNADNVPGMPVFDTLLRIIAADGNHAPDSKSIAQHLHRFGNAFTNSHALP